MFSWDKPPTCGFAFVLDISVGGIYSKQYLQGSKSQTKPT